MRRAVIADDHGENLYFLEVLLKGNGFDTVDSAENGEHRPWRWPGKTGLI